MKFCSLCKIEKKDSEFGKEKFSKDGLRYWCRKCCKEYSKRYYVEIIKPKNPPKTIVRECAAGNKFCVKCNIEKPKSSFYKKSTNICKKCEIRASKERRLKNPDLFKQRQKESRIRRKKQIKEARDKYRRTHSMKGYSNKKAKEYRAKLSDAYIKSRIRARGTPNSLITPQIIEEWRVKVLLERLKKIITKQGTKICENCKKVFPLSNFYTKKWVWKGVEKIQYNNYCKSCSNERTKTYRK